jgi:CRISPR-associated protein (TIGR02710 family)
MFLERKISQKNNLNNDNIYFYLPDLLNNAYRRIKEGKYDDAVARLYRVMELVAQLKLNKLGIVDNDSIRNFKFDINKNSFKNYASENYQDILTKLNIKNFTSSKSTFTLAMYNDFNMLRYLNDEIGNYYIKDNKVQRELEKRNNSVLAHGLRPINKINAIKLYDYSVNYAKLLCSDVEVYMKLGSFPKFQI